MMNSTPSRPAPATTTAVLVVATVVATVGMVVPPEQAVTPIITASGIPSQVLFLTTISILTSTLVDRIYCPDYIISWSLMI